MRTNALMLAMAGALLVASGSAGAVSTKSTTLTVNAAVNPNCIVSAGTLTFPAYDGTTVKTGQSDVLVRCSNLTPYTLKLGTGGGTFAQRLMSGPGSNKLEYNLYTTAAVSTIWGDGTLTTGTVPGTGSGMSAAAEKTHTVYGQIPNSTNNQNAPGGAYTDSVSVTIEY
jgi:spore coat protein U domain-containing protein, fimbrial subunit CupE1/2/3/6